VFSKQTTKIYHMLEELGREEQARAIKEAAKECLVLCNNLKNKDYPADLQQEYIKHQKNLSNLLVYFLSSFFEFIIQVTLLKNMPKQLSQSTLLVSTSA